MSLIDFSTAKLARSKGCNEISSLQWVHDPYYNISTISDWEIMKGKWDDEYYELIDPEGFYALSQEELRQWLFDNHDIEIFLYPQYDSVKYGYDAYKLIGYSYVVFKGDKHVLHSFSFHTHLKAHYNEHIAPYLTFEEFLKENGLNMFETKKEALEEALINALDNYL